MAGVSWPTLAAGSRARASDVELKFDWIEGDLVPMLAGSKTTGVYDIGTSAFKWRSAYFSTRVNTPALGLSDTSFLSFDAGGTSTVAVALKLSAGVAVNEFSIDQSLGGNSDLAVPTEKAVKQYVDSAGGGPVSFASGNFGSVVLGSFGTTLTSLSVTSDGGVYQFIGFAYALFTTTSTSPAGALEIIKDAATIASLDSVPGGFMVLRMANQHASATAQPLGGALMVMGFMSLTSGGHTFDLVTNGNAAGMQPVTSWSFQIRKIHT